MSHVQDLIIDKAYIGGQWRDADRHFSVTNPATGETLAEVPDLNAEEVREAIGAADAACAGWKRTSLSPKAPLNASRLCSSVRSARANTGSRWLKRWPM